VDPDPDSKTVDSYPDPGARKLSGKIYFLVILNKNSTTERYRYHIK
jgi:hypothetical protein